MINTMSKNKFVKLMKELSQKRRLWDQFQASAEELSPGEYVNFWPFLWYEDQIRFLLNNMFGYAGQDDTPIDWFMVEGQYGREPSYLVYEEDGEQVDIRTVDKLYNKIKADQLVSMLRQEAAKENLKKELEALRKETNNDK